MKAAASAEPQKDNGHFNGFLRDPLAQLQSRFDLKYWPTLAEFSSNWAQTQMSPLHIPTIA